MMKIIITLVQYEMKYIERELEDRTKTLLVLLLAKSQSTPHNLLIFLERKKEEEEPNNKVGKIPTQHLTTT